MFIPLHDANSLKHIKLQYVTIGLIVAQCASSICSPVAAAVEDFANAAVSGSATSLPSPSTCRAAARSS